MKGPERSVGIRKCSIKWELLTQIFCRTWKLMRGERYALASPSHMRTEAAGWLKVWGQVSHWRLQHNSTLATGNKKNSGEHSMLIFSIMPDTVLSMLHLLLCDLILKALLWRRCYCYPHSINGETKEKNRFKTNNMPKVTQGIIIRTKI